MRDQGNTTSSSQSSTHRVRVRGGFLRRTDAGWEAVTMAELGSEVVFAVAVEIEPVSETPHEIVIELRRGDLLRDRRAHEVRRAEDLPWRGTYRINWTNRRDASSRLGCCVFVDGVQAGMWQLLVQSSAADAQGRLQFDTRHNDSLETRLAYEDEFAALLEHFRTSSP